MVATDYVKRAKREMMVEVTTAYKLSPMEKENYESIFKQRIRDERTKLIMTTKEDPSLLGGAIFNVNGNVVDLSWKSQQEKLLSALESGGSL